ncbi:MAG: hypothetical protein ACKPGL_06270, partial [Dolichospermum sp.]
MTTENNNSTREPTNYPPTDGKEIVTISRADFNAIVEKAVSEAVQQFELMFARAVGEATGKSEKWLNTAAAAAVLGKRKEQLRKMVKDGRLRLHEEVRDDRPKRATRPVYMFHIQKCKKRLLTSPEEREI